MASAERPQRSSQPGESADRTSATAPGDEKIPPELLEHVVAETVAAGMPSASGGELDALLDVARRHRGQPLDHEPVVRDLVLAILRLRFARLTLPDRDWQDMARTVAATLLEAPDTQAQLQSFWDRLGQAQA